MADAGAREAGDDALGGKGFGFEGAHPEQAPVSDVRGARAESAAGKPAPTIRLVAKVADPVCDPLGRFRVRRRTGKQAVPTDAPLRHLDDETGLPGSPITAARPAREAPESRLGAGRGHPAAPQPFRDGKPVLNHGLTGMPLTRYEEYRNDTLMIDQQL